MIIGLHGEIGSGKDTVADYLVSDYGFNKVAFKDALVDALCHIFDLEPEVFSDRILKETPHPKLYGHTPRDVMRTFGTDWARNMVSGNIWTDNTFRFIDSMFSDSNVVISDVRFPNEAENIHARNGLIAYMDRPDNPFKKTKRDKKWYDFLFGAKKVHPSDVPLDDKYIDYIFYNRYSIETLHDKVDIFMSIRGFSKI